MFVLNDILILGIWRSALSHPQEVFAPGPFSEHRIQHGAIVPLYVTSIYSTSAGEFQAFQLIVLAAFGVVE